MLALWSVFLLSCIILASATYPQRLNAFGRDGGGHISDNCPWNHRASDLPSERAKPGPRSLHDAVCSVLCLQASTADDDKRNRAMSVASHTGPPRPDLRARGAGAGGGGAGGSGSGGGWARLGTGRPSHKLAYFLRHAPPCPMDAGGWVRVSELLPHLGASEEELRRAVANDRKGRFELGAEAGRVRACQGHSVSLEAPVLTPVESPEHLSRLLSALGAGGSGGGGLSASAAAESSSSSSSSTPFAAHCTTEEAWAQIQRDGFIRRMQRSHVHFATSGRLARRSRGVTVALVLDVPRALAEGRRLFLSTNGVLLSADDVPVHLVRARAVADVQELRLLL